MYNFLSYRLFVCLLIVLPAFCRGQNFGNDKVVEQQLIASTKQIGQFFRRFNNEESIKGKIYDKSHPAYHEKSQRKKYLQIIFDRQAINIAPQLKTQFINFVLNYNDTGYFIGFHRGQWFAELRTKLKIDGTPQVVWLFFAIQEEKVGSKWVLINCYLPSLDKLFTQYAADTNAHFLHPMSHEIDFMNLNKMFAENRAYYNFVERDFFPSHLSIFIYKLVSGNVQLIDIQALKFHFFQVPGWYFAIEEQLRKGYNSGWLITQLKKITEKEKTKQLKRIFLNHGDF